MADATAKETQSARSTSGSPTPESSPLPSRGSSPKKNRCTACHSSARKSGSVHATRRRCAGQSYVPSRLKLADDGHSASSQRTKSCIKNPCRTQQHGWTFFVKSIASSSPPPSAHSPWRIQTLCTTTSPTWFHGNSFVSKSPGHQFNGDFQEISSSLTEEQCWSIRMAKLPLKPKHWMACISQSNGSPKVWPMASSGMGLAIPSSPHHQRSNLPNMIYHNLNQAKSNLHNQRLHPSSRWSLFRASQTMSLQK